MKRYEVLAGLVNQRRYRRIVEVGVRDGETMLSLLASCPSIERYYAVDSDKDASFLAHTHDPRVIAILEPSVSASFKVEDKSVDLVFIDAAYDERSVFWDIGVWSPKVRPGGAITGYDYGNPAHRAVKQVVDLFFGPRVIDHEENGAYVWEVLVHEEDEIKQCE